VRLGPLTIGALQIGKWRALTPSEVAALARADHESARA
jgi:16S rRNA U516 pseudouridylate synthase RsuA-like enzyme